MGFKIVQMMIRGFSLMLCTLGLFYNSESTNLTSVTHFLMTGVYGSYVVVTLGLMIEAGIGTYTDEFIETFFLILGVIFNLTTTAVAFYEYYALVMPSQDTMNKGFVSISIMVLFLVDLSVLHCTD